ncbi:hypothetical protein V1527DRAFT_522421 [Lipomyces starkeyi]
MDHITATAATPSTPANAPYNLYEGMVLDTVENAREVVKAYAIQHNFALKKGLVKNKDTRLLLLCKCALKTFNSRKLPLQKEVIGDNNLVRQKDARSMLCDCPWRLGVPLDVTQIHPRWRVQVSLPVLEVTKQNLGTSVLSQLKDPVVLLKRNGQPRRTRRLQTSAEIVQRAERVRHCGSCHQAGHNRRSCGRLAESTAMHEHGIDGDGEEDGEEDVEHIVGGSSLTEVWDDVLARLFEGLPGIVCILRKG